MNEEEYPKKLNDSLLSDSDTLASDNFEGIDRRFPTENEYNILKLIRPICPKCKKNSYWRWDIISLSSNGNPIEIKWVCFNHPEKSKQWPMISYDINDLLKEKEE